MRCKCEKFYKITVINTNGNGLWSFTVSAEDIKEARKTARQKTHNTICEVKLQNSKGGHNMTLDNCKRAATVITEEGSKMDAGRVRMMQMMAGGAIMELCETDSHEAAESLAEALRKVRPGQEVKVDGCKLKTYDADLMAEALTLKRPQFIEQILKESEQMNG